MAIWDATKQKWVKGNNAPAASNEPLQSGPSAKYNSSTGLFDKPKPRVVKYWELGSANPLVVWDPTTSKYTYTSSYKEPKYTFNEAMGLAGKGYTGLYGRSADKKTIGLMGENWQQAYALSNYRNQLNIKPATIGADIMVFFLMLIIGLSVRMMFLLLIRIILLRLWLMLLRLLLVLSVVMRIRLLVLSRLSIRIIRLILLLLVLSLVV